MTTTRRKTILFEFKNLLTQQNTGWTLKQKSELEYSDEIGSELDKGLDRLDCAVEDEMKGSQ